MSEVLETLFFEKFFLKNNLFEKKSGWSVTEKKNLLYNSVIKNISHILNTTSHLNAPEFLQTKLSVTEYGIPDLSPYISLYYVDTNMMSKCIAHALSFYEKRVENVKVEVNGEGEQKIIYLTGYVKGLENISEILAYKLIGGG